MEENFYIEDQDEKKSNPVNIKRITGRVLQYWYLVILSLIIALGIAFLINRYADRIYPSKISLIIKESEEVSGSAEILYNNPLVDPYRNFYNEIYIIKSIPLIQEVVEELNLMISYRHEGNVRTSEVYNLFPFTTILLSDSTNVAGGSFRFKILNDEKFIIKLNENSSIEGSFNDTINLNGIELYFAKPDNVSLHRFDGVEFILTIQNSLQLAKQFAARLTIEWAEQGSSVVNIGLTGEVPEKNVDFLNQLAVEYAEYDLEKKVQTASKTIDFIERQLSEIEDSLTIYETKLENFKVQNYTTELDSRSATLLANLENLESEKGEILIYKNYFDYLRNYLNNPDKELEQVVLPTMVGINDAVINNLLTRLLDVQNTIKQLPDQVENNNPLVNTAYKQLQEIKRQLLESIKNIEKTQQIALQRLNEKSNTIEAQLASLPATQRRLITINRNYKFSERLYDFLIQKKTEADITKASSTSDIAVVNPAVSGGPISPDVMRNYLLAGAAGLGLPIILFILFEVMNRKVQSKEDIETITNIPFVGSVGHAKQESNLMVYHKPKSGMAEAFRAIRSNLNYFTEAKDKKAFLITSSISGEGKTFSSINLATVLAFSGKRTVIIGADMRRPRIFDDFNLKNNIGLSSYLSDQKGLDECIQETFIDNLSLLTAGPVPPNPSELLLKDKFSKLINLLKERFDYILIDSPPIALVTDALVIAQYVDHVIFIVRQNRTPQDALQNINEFYKTGKLDKLSILFNDIKKTGLGYGYGKGYGYYYGYGYKADDSYYED